MLKNVLQICLVCILNGKLYTDAISVGQLQIPGGQWAIDILQTDTSLGFQMDDERGFDFTDEEMKELKLWPHGVIPYYIDDVSFDKVLRDRIRTYLDIFGGQTGVNFNEVPSPPQDPSERWVFFVNRRGLLDCAEHSITNFTTEGIQKITLGYDCLRNSGGLGEVAMEIVGVPPQHNAPNRDEYIDVHFDKIIPGKEYLFKKLEDKQWLFHELPYDFSSIGHFHYHEYSVDGTATISPKQPNNIRVGVGETSGLSATDVSKVRMLYSYISKKKRANGKGSECNKLFKRKPNTHTAGAVPLNLEPSELQPRPKPNRYLGIHDEPKNNKNDPSDDKENNEAEKTDDNDQKDDKNESDSDGTVNNNKASQNNDDDDDDDENNNDNGEVKRLKGNSVSIHSYYKSEDEKFHHLAANNKARYQSSSSKSSRFITESGNLLSDRNKKRFQSSTSKSSRFITEKPDTRPHPLI